MRSVLLMALALGSSVALAADPAPDPAPDPPSTPAWAREQLPQWVRPFVGRPGLPGPWNEKPGPLGSAVAGIDRHHANHFVVYRAETARYLYDSYTPTSVTYRAGTLPAYEVAVARFTRPAQTPRQQAEALLAAMPQILRHPTIPPCGPAVRSDRGLLDEALLATGGGFCNEQARVFVRLCQVAGIPARLVFLFYADDRTGHTVAEFFADGGWAMADTSWMVVFPDVEGRLLSAEALHAPAGKAVADRVYRERFVRLLKLSDDELGPGDNARRRRDLQARSRQPDELKTFGLMNYPLP